MNEEGCLPWEPLQRNLGQICPQLSMVLRWQEEKESSHAESAQVLYVFRSLKAFKKLFLILRLSFDEE